MEHPILKIKPRTLPRDFRDILICLFVAVPIQITPVFFLPSGLVWWLTGSFVLGFLAFIIIYAVWICYTVWSLELSSNGIRFVRLCGTPRILRWEEIVDISEAPRREVVLHGWLWPMRTCLFSEIVRSCTGRIRTPPLLQSSSPLQFSLAPRLKDRLRTCRQRRSANTSQWLPGWRIRDCPGLEGWPVYGKSQGRLGWLFVSRWPSIRV
jgi:hypothetical protein